MQITMMRTQCCGGLQSLERGLEQCHDCPLTTPVQSDKGNTDSSTSEPRTDTASRGAHTPGPWHVEGRSIWALMPNPDKAGIRRGHPEQINRFSACVQDHPGCPQEEKQANARLIAAAPDLLEALTKLLARAEAELADPQDVGEVAFAHVAIARATVA